MTEFAIQVVTQIWWVFFVLVALVLLVAFFEASARYVSRTIFAEKRRHLALMMQFKPGDGGDFNSVERGTKA